MQPDDLYGLPLDQFIPERTAFAKALRAEKKRDEASTVAALRKPSVAAWAVNQLVRSQATAVGELYDAGDALAEAQQNILAGSGDGRALRAANERERAAVEQLVRAARGLLDADGHELSASVVERVSDTLHAAALDPDAREQVRPGRLERELRHAGLGLGESVFAPAAPPQKAAAKAKPAPREKQPRVAATRTTETKAQRAERSRAAHEQAENAQQVERGREAARKAARSQESVARRRVKRGEAALRVAEQRRERAAGALAAADEALSAAQDEMREAAAGRERARAELDGL